MKSLARMVLLAAVTVGGCASTEYFEPESIAVKEVTCAPDGATVVNFETRDEPPYRCPEVDIEQTKANVFLRFVRSDDKDVAPVGRVEFKNPVRLPVWIANNKRGLRLWMPGERERLRKK